MHALRLPLLLVASLFLALRLPAQTNAPVATLAEQLERTRRQLETQFATNRPPNFEQLVQERAESAFYLPRFTTAVQTGDTNALRQLFRDHPALMDARTLEGPSVQGKAPLMVAAERGDLGMVDFLLRRKVSPDAVSPGSGFPFSSRAFPRSGPTDYAPQRNTPLHAAARGGHVEVVARLLEGGALVETRDSYSAQTALAGCVQRVSGQSAYQSPAVQPGTEAYQRQLEVIRVLLKHGAQVVPSTSGGWLNDPLALAASRGNAELLDQLLTNSIHADISVTNRFGPRETLLHAAVRMGRTNALATLLARRPPPDLTRTNAVGLTPLQLTAGNVFDLANTGVQQVYISGPDLSFQTIHLHRRTCAELLLQAGAELDIFTAAGSDRAEDVRRWLARSAAAASSTDARGRTPLHWAVLARATSATDVLLAEKAPVNAADTRGTTVLALATSQGDVPLVTRLLAAGADVHPADGQGSTALHHAAALASAEPLQLLLLAGAKPDARDKRGKTALDLAVAANQTNNVRQLLAAMPSGSQQAKAMLVEVFLTAVGKGDLSQVTNWLAQGVDVNARDAQGRTALRLAADAGRMDLLAALHRAGADVNLADTNGVTPLMSRVSLHRTPLDERLLTPAAPALLKREATLPERFRSPALAPPGEPLFWLLAHGGDLARTNRQGMTALFYLPAVESEAYSRGPVEQVRLCTVLARYLVQRGAKPNARDAQGMTALHHALLGGDLTRAFALLEAGASLEVADRLGRTAIHHASMGVGASRVIGRPDVTQHAPSAKEKNLGPILVFVIANGADVRKVDQQGRTPLHTLLAERPAESVYFAPLLLTNKHGAALVRTADKSNALPAHLAFARLAATDAIEATRLAIQLARPVVVSAGPDAQGRNLLHLAAALPHLWPPGRQPAPTGPARFPAEGLPAGMAQEWRELLGKLAERKALVQHADAVGDTPLHEAARHNHGELARLLLAHGADPKARNRKGQTPLDVANTSSSPARPSSVIPLLTGAWTGQGVAPAPLASPPVLKPDPKAQPLPAGATTNFWTAIQTGDLVSVDAYLRENPTLATASNQTTVPLRAAAVAGQLAVATKLRTAGASDLAAAVLLGWTNTVESVLGYQPERAAEVVEGFPLLHWAAQRGQLATARLLLARLTPPFAPDRLGLSARYHARTNAEPKLLELLERAGDQFTLFDAIALRDAGLAAQVIARLPTAVSQLNAATETPLFAATVANDLALVKVLLAAKADPNQRSNVTPIGSRSGGVTNTFFLPGNLPLHWAAWTNAVVIGQLLLDHGAEVDAATRVGASALQYAAAQGHQAFAELLVRPRAKINFQDTPPLDQFGYPSGPTVVNGCTALHYAVKHGQVEMVRWLLDKGADTELRDVWGQSPREVAMGTPSPLGRGFGLAEPRHGPRTSPFSPIQMLAPVEASVASTIRGLLLEHRRKLAEGR